MLVSGDTENKKKFQFSFFFTMDIPLNKIPFSLPEVGSLIGQKKHKHKEKY